MMIWVDADGCPVIETVISIASARHLPVSLVCDTAHDFSKYNYAQTVTVSKGSDSADFMIVNRISPGDVVVTQDYGLAAMCLSRNARVIHQDGFIYDSGNIDSLLMQRHFAKKIRAGGGRLSGPSKRTKEQTLSFEKAFSSLLNDIEN